MDENVVKQKIQKAFSEPQAPEEEIRQVILRSRAIVMGNEAKKLLEAGMAENLPSLVACTVIGQLAEVSKLPDGAATGTATGLYSSIARRQCGAEA
jgi:hypothetical protein